MKLLYVGTCAVIITENGKHRSLCANLAAATCFTINFVEEIENKRIITKADYYYITVGFNDIVNCVT